MEMYRSAQDNRIRIGVIGPQPIVHQALRMLAAFPSFTPVTKVSEREEDAPELAAGMAGEVDDLDNSGKRRILPQNCPPWGGFMKPEIFFSARKEYAMECQIIYNI